MENQAHEGERLLLLVRRSKMLNSEVAEMLEIATTSVSRIYRSERLSDKVRKKAIAGFGLPEDYFSAPGDVVMEVTPKYEPIEKEERDLRNEVERLRKELAALAAEMKKRGDVESKLLDIITQLTKK